jgi:hypothetical protein
MENNNATYVFECLLRDNTFMSSIDQYITNTISSTQTFDAKNVPQLVLILMTLFARSNNFIDVNKNLKNETELQNLLEIFYTYIIDHIKEQLTTNKFKEEEFKKSYDICVRLAMLKLKFSGKSGLKCIGK